MGDGYVARMTRESFEAVFNLTGLLKSNAQQVDGKRGQLETNLWLESILNWVSMNQSNHIVKSLSSNTYKLKKKGFILYYAHIHIILFRCLKINIRFKKPN